MTCKWLVKNHGDRKSPKDRVVGPLPNGRTPWLVNEGDPLTTCPSPGMILQVGSIHWHPVPPLTSQVILSGGPSSK